MIVTLLLDESGSMSPYRDSTIKSIKEYIKSLGSEDIRITLTGFDDENFKHVFFTNKKPEDAKKWAKYYQPRGLTPLYDAIMDRVCSTEQIKAKRVVFAIMTDGAENASKKYFLRDVQEAIKKHSDWTWVFLGANIDAYRVGTKLGIARDNIQQYNQGKEELLMQEMSMATTTHARSSAQTSSTFFKPKWVAEDHPRDSAGRFVSK